AASAWHKPLLAFLEAGGVLLTTDWSLENLVQPLFPGYLRKNGTASGQFPLRVRCPGHPLLEGLDKTGGTPWVVESMSSRIDVVNAREVEVLLDAPAMGDPAAILVAFAV